MSVSHVNEGAVVVFWHLLKCYKTDLTIHDIRSALVGDYVITPEEAERLGLGKGAFWGIAGSYDGLSLRDAVQEIETYNKLSATDLEWFRLHRAVQFFNPQATLERVHTVFRYTPEALVPKVVTRGEWEKLTGDTAFARSMTTYGNADFPTATSTTINVVHYLESSAQSCYEA